MQECARSGLLVHEMKEVDDCNSSETPSPHPIRGLVERPTQIQADINEMKRKAKASFMINAIIYFLGKALPLLVTLNEKKREQTATQRDQGHAKASIPASYHRGRTVRASSERNLCRYSLAMRYP